MGRKTDGNKDMGADAGARTRARQKEKKAVKTERNRAGKKHSNNAGTKEGTNGNTRNNTERNREEECIPRRKKERRDACRFDRNERNLRTEEGTNNDGGNKGSKKNIRMNRRVHEGGEQRTCYEKPHLEKEHG